MNDRYNAGLKRRVEVLGDGHSKRLASATQTDDFLAPMFEHVTEFAWGGPWSRDGLPTKLRCVATVAMLVALNRQHELEIHVRGALRNGVTRRELQELLLHTAAYCGWPASMEAFRTAKRVIDEAEAQGAAPATPT